MVQLTERGEVHRGVRKEWGEEEEKVTAVRKPRSHRQECPDGGVCLALRGQRIWHIRVRASF